ncbi:hypothetical protein J7I97_16865 [Streptomyces sp. ISL-87]|uniref:hypothetical protein n=1 Tax=Streptomyces sp. ISL-87 TaxID=2819188 RepID=UPI001BE849C2|nr:hypothetical protein [Streptomyces sp. ISL-87]MBT2609899.1 hypothetical protein [Streptomyces sp. ISL-87]
MHKIVLTAKVMELLDGTGVMQGDECPEIKAEMDALKHTKKGASGEVSLSTVGWLLDTLDGLAEGKDAGDNMAIAAALAKLNPIYEENGGTWTTAGALREAEEGRASLSELEPDEEGQEPEEHGEKGGGAGVSGPQYGNPVYHAHTRELVGYLSPGKFTPITEVAGPHD